MEADEAPVLQEYVDAPLAVNVAELPTHILELVEATIGKLVTEIVPTAEFVQPVKAVPITVYPVVVVGFAEIVDVVAPVFHK